MTSHPVDHHINHISSPCSVYELKPPTSFHPPLRPSLTVFVPSEQPPHCCHHRSSSHRLRLRLNSRNREMAVLLLSTRQQLHLSNPPSSPSNVMKLQESQQEWCRKVSSTDGDAFLCNCLAFEFTPSWIREMVPRQPTAAAPTQSPPFPSIVSKLQESPEQRRKCKHNTVWCVMFLQMKVSHLTTSLLQST